MMQTCVCILVMLLVCMVNFSTSQPPTEGCHSCRWVNHTTSSTLSAATVKAITAPATPGGNSPPPAVGLVFVHMRKSGGTAFLHSFIAWMYEHRCFGHKLKRNTNGAAGIREGQVLSFDERKRKAYIVGRCSMVDLQHVEYHCLHGGMFNSHLSSRDARANTRLRILTILRHPIDRIISQAFYGRWTLWAKLYQQAVQHCSVFEMEEKRCLGSVKSNTSMCNCMRNVTNSLMQQVQTNVSIWEKYLGESTFFDGYNENYYIKRIANCAQPSSISIDNFKKAANCSNLVAARSSTSTSICGDVAAFDLMDSLALESVCKCNLNNKRRMLTDAKQILKDQFDVLILEFMSEDDSVRTLAEVLGETDTNLLRRSMKAGRKHSAPSMLADLGIPSRSYRTDAQQTQYTEQFKMSKFGNIALTKYEYLLPVPIRDLLHEQNAEDLELYNYAVELFRNRTQTDSSSAGAISGHTTTSI